MNIFHFLLRFLVPKRGFLHSARKLPRLCKGFSVRLKSLNRRRKFAK